MKLTPDTLATIFGSVSAIAQMLGQTGVVNQPTAGTISAIAIALLGLVSNKPKSVG
jgi:uncharacterized membrane protein